MNVNEASKVTSKAGKRRHPYDVSQRFVHELDVYVDRAADGDPEAAKVLLAGFVNSVEQGTPPDPRLLAYLANAFRGMLDEGGRDPRHHLGLLRKKAGNPQLVTEKRPMTQGQRAELQQMAYELLASEATDAAVIVRLSEEVIVPARHVGRDTAREMVRHGKKMLQMERALRSAGHEYDGHRLIAMHFDTDEETVRSVLKNLKSRADHQEQ